MKQIYESFSEIADDFTDGEHWTHQLSNHTADECFPWQHGVKEFAEFLDEMGVKIIQNPEIHAKLWKRIRTFKPLIFTEHKEGE